MCCRDDLILINSNIFTCILFVKEKYHLSYANIVGPDLTLRSVASDLCLHCLPVPFMLETSNVWVT